LEFSGTPLRIAAKANGKPDCTVNPQIGKSATSFAFRPPGCTPDNCTGVRALVLSTDNSDAVADDSLLYTCNVDIAAEAPEGIFALGITNVIASTPAGSRIPDAAGAAGLVVVRLGPIPTPAANGAACQFLTDCQSTACVDGACCAQAQCRFDESCNVSGNEGRCTPRLAAGSPCGRDADCQLGLFCQTDGVCARQPSPNGAYCGVDDDCASVYCVDGVCCAARCAAGQVCNAAENFGQCVVPPTRTTTQTPRATRTPQPPPSTDLFAEVLEIDSTTNTARVGVRLLTRNSIAGIQNDLLLAAPNARFLAGADGQPDCAVNAAINKAGTAFAFLADGCDNEGCTSLRAIVVAFDNIDPIASGALLYTCVVEVTGDSHELDVTRAIASSPSGDPIEVVGHGTTVSSQPVRLFAADGYVDSSTLLGQVSVFLGSAGHDVAGTQNDLRLEGPGAAVLRKSNGKPDCTVNPDINKAATSFAFRPPSCTLETCTGIRALVLSSDNTDPITDGVALYTCRITAASWASVFVEGVIAASTSGERIPAIGLNNDTLFGGPTPTPQG
jgi:hypothetical protein